MVCITHATLLVTTMMEECDIVSQAQLVGRQERRQTILLLGHPLLSEQWPLTMTCQAHYCESMRNTRKLQRHHVRLRPSSRPATRYEDNQRGDRKTTKTDAAWTMAYVRNH